MGFKSDIEIAQECEMKPITEIAAKAGIEDKYLEQYGKYKAKIDYNLLKETDKKDGKLILVTAINPTPAGEGKTTTTVGLADAMQKLGKNVMVALREPSLGPVFGVKGGAAGGGYAQVVPMEDINLHFTGDFHAIGAANNLLAAMIDNHIFQGNALNIDPRKITWRRCVDMNDRQLRNVVDGLGGRTNGMPREDGYDITVASEIMAVLCLASDITDLKKRLARMIVTVMSLLLTPLFLLYANNPEILPDWLMFTKIEQPEYVPIFWQLLILELAVDGLKLAAINTPSTLNTPLSLIAAIVIGEFSVNTGWFNQQTMLYMAVVAIANFTHENYELAYSVKFLRIIMLIFTQIFGLYGFIGGIIFTLAVVGLNKTIAGTSYVYPLMPLDFKVFLQRFYRVSLKAKNKK